jgi:transposase
MDIHEIQTYTNKEVSEVLCIGDSTLRKWCLLFEEHGYQFKKDENDRRQLTERDIILLKKFRELKESGLEQENAVNKILSDIGVSRTHKDSEKTPPVQHDERIKVTVHEEIILKVDHLLKNPQLPLRFYYNGYQEALRELIEQWEGIKEGTRSQQN